MHFVRCAALVAVVSSMSALVSCSDAPEPSTEQTDTAQAAIDRNELLDAMTWLDQYYASSEGLQRPDGLSLGGKPDFEGIAAWVFDVFLGSRLAGLDVETCRQNVVYSIQQTEEWKTKHPGGGSATWTPFSATVSLDRNEFLRALWRLDVFYRSWNGLQRPDGLSIGGKPDFEGIAAWVFDVYLNARLAQVAPEAAWDAMVSQIRNTEEWQSRPRQPADASTLIGKHLMGYQGWFGAPGDGHNGGWSHWFGGNPTPEDATFDLWPDTRELFDSELWSTTMTLKNGQPARLFSSHHERTVRRHFDWMADAGIDGVSLGRFSAGTSHGGILAQLDHIVANVRVAAEGAGRVFFIWYDVTGNDPSTLVSDLQKDWMRLVDQHQVTASPSYLRHHGKPLLGVWGVGAGDRPGTPAEWLSLIDFFKNHPDPKYRSTVLVGGAADWRDNPTWAPVFEQADVVSPWAVGAFGDDAGADGYKTSILEPDLAVTKSRGQDYLPIVFPGFSWHNLQNGQSPLNAVPRRGGRFYWRQVHNAVSAGVDNLFTAMFDEVDEGTAMLKAVSTQGELPAQGSFLSLDVDGEQLPSDWYLRLGGAAGRMVRKEIPLSAQIPIVP
jgi:hypothetical protein